jgi:hypothetical protein
MKKLTATIITIAIALALTLAACGGGAGGTYSGTIPDATTDGVNAVVADGVSTVSISELTGTANIARGGEDITAQAGMRLMNRDTLRTFAESAAWLLLEEDRAVELGELTALNVDRQAKGFVLTLSEGGITARIDRPLASGEEFTVMASNLALAVRGTIFTARIDGSVVTVSVERGEVAVIDGGGNEIATVKAGESLSFDTGNDNAVVAAPLPGPTPPPITAAVGDLIEFGGYEWRVLEVSDGKALIMTDKLIGFSTRYHGANEPVTWADCDLRAYLNGAFYNSFPDADRARIAATQNANNDNPWYDDGTRGIGGADTTDKIFLLSLEEVVKYFGDSGQLANQPQSDVYRIDNIDDAYNDARIAYDTNGEDWPWWLRSPGASGNGAASVSMDGQIYVRGNEVTSGGYIRPALWLSLDYPENPDYALAPVSSPPSLNPATQVGDTVVFGIYRWRVLAVEGGKALILSDRVISDNTLYHKSDTGITWADCDLRAYLNGDFYNRFNPMDKARIVLTRNSNKNNQWYYAEALELNQGADFFMPPPEGGADTDDYIFLLSLEEVVKYLGDSGQLANRPSKDVSRIDDQYNEARIGRRVSSEDTRAWWLRSPGSIGIAAAFVDSNGTIIVGGLGVDYGQNSVRPAMWVSLG